MKRATLIALVAAPIVGGAAGVMIGRTGAANADDSVTACVEPSVYVDFADGVSMVTGGAEAVAACDGPICTIAGAHQVEISADGRVQCVNVDESQTLTLMRRSDGVALTLE